MRPTARSFVSGYFQDSRLTEVLVTTFWRRPFEPISLSSLLRASPFFRTPMLPQLFMCPPPSPRYMKDLRNRTWSSKPVVANLCCCKEGAGTASPLASVEQVTGQYCTNISCSLLCRRGAKEYQGYQARRRSHDCSCLISSTVNCFECSCSSAP